MCVECIKLECVFFSDNSIKAEGYILKIATPPDFEVKYHIYDLVDM